MTEPTQRKPRNLLGILAFLRKYPGRVALCFGLLLVNIAIEMTLPQILGDAITGVRQHVATGALFSMWPFVQLYGLLITVRAGVGFVLGPIRSRTVLPKLRQRVPMTATGTIGSRASIASRKLPALNFATWPSRLRVPSA